jgi:DNA-binding transcriptional LysR family regulator
VLDDQLRVGDVHDLRAFALASELRSLTAVAKVMGESKATVSRRITRLEAALGVALMRRSSRGIAVTEDGAAYRDRVAQVLEMLGSANAAVMRGAKAAPSGQLRVSIPPGLTSALAPSLSSFGAAYPQVVLVVHAAARFVDLEAESFDVALRSTSRLVDSSLVAVRVGDPEPEGILVATAGYLGAHGIPRRPHELAAHRFVALAETGGRYTLPLVHRTTGKPLSLPLPVAVAASDLGLVKDLVLSGAGISSLPRLSVQRELEERALVHVLPAYIWPSTGLFLLHRGGTFVAPKVRAFIDHMKRALAPRRRS